MYTIMGGGGANQTSLLLGTDTCSQVYTVWLDENIAGCGNGSTSQNSWVRAHLHICRAVWLRMTSIVRRPMEPYNALWAVLNPLQTAH